MRKNASSETQIVAALRLVEKENRKLERLVADLTLVTVILQEAFAKTPEGHMQRYSRAGGAGARSFQ